MICSNVNRRMIITTHRNATVICINVLDSAYTKQPEGQTNDTQNKYAHPDPLHYTPQSKLMTLQQVIY